jgi:circadian clock protein KaiA
LSASLAIAIFTDSPSQAKQLAEYLDREPYSCGYFSDPEEFMTGIIESKHELDCLLFYAPDRLIETISLLQAQHILLPAAIVDRSGLSSMESEYLYQPCEVIIPPTEIADLATAIDSAIAKFLNLTPVERLNVESEQPLEAVEIDVSKSTFLIQQQNRLANKLRERLGYLAVYYKRNSSQFYRHLDPDGQRELITDLERKYRGIVLDYFQENSGINDAIDELVSAVFFADLSVSEVVKIHMDLMEDFAKQLKIEGRSEDILLDYRLTLIDIIAHLCEMYRRSIPREL